MSLSAHRADLRLRRRLFAASALATFVFGMIVAMLGALFGLPAMRERLAIDLAGQGGLFSALFLGLLAGTAIVGPAIDRRGTKPVMVAGGVMVTAAVAALALARGFGAAAAAALLLGAGGGWLNTASNALVSDLYPDDRGRMLNLLGAFFGLGALFVPLVMSIGFDLLSVSGVLAICAAVAGAGTIAAAALPHPPPHEGSGFSLAGVLGAAKNPGVALLAALLLFEGANETALSGWTSTYIGVMGWSPRVATLVLLGYWVVAILGRTVSARLQALLGKARLVAGAGALVVAGCLVLLAAASSLPGLVAGAWIASFGISAIFPTTLAIAGDRYHRFAGTVFGLLFTAGNLGNVLSPSIMGHISQSAGMRAGMMVPLAGAAAVTALAIVVASRGPSETPVEA